MLWWYSSVHTSQQKARAAMHAAGVPRERRLEFSPEVILTITKLDWLKLVTINGVKKTRMKHLNLPLPRFAKYLHTWGEAGTVKTGNDGNAGNCGVTCMFVGCASNHKGDCCRMWNPKTKMVSATCDMVFLNQMFSQAPVNTKRVHKEQENPNPEDTEIESV
jgi:hypothetical protein